MFLPEFTVMQKADCYCPSLVKSGLGDTECNHARTVSALYRAHYSLPTIYCKLPTEHKTLQTALKFLKCKRNEKNAYSIN